MLARAVIVTRASAYQQLLATHGTHGQARFFLKQREQSIEDLVHADRLQRAAVKAVAQVVPSAWRQARVVRGDLDRFLFEPEDVVVVVGQDGLVANVARFLDGQVVIGVNPDRSAFDGVLVRWDPADTAEALGEGKVEARTMVVAETDDGQQLRALNEVFIGHRSHQSARYRLRVGQLEERQSSSGLVVATGTGATGWAASICRRRVGAPVLPDAQATTLVWMVREAWPSRVFGCGLSGGLMSEHERLELVCENDEGGVVFGDGIEQDRLRLSWGQRVVVRRSRRTLNLRVR